MEEEIKKSTEDRRKCEENENGEEVEKCSEENQKCLELSKNDKPKVNINNFHIIITYNYKK